MSYQCFTNAACEFFPCHAGIEAVAFNCLFCYCPLYALGKNCGGNPVYDNARGIKDCSNCSLPHRKDRYDWVLARLETLVEQTAQHEKEQP